MIEHTDTSQPYCIPNTRVYQARRTTSGGQEQEYRLFVYKPEEPPPSDGYTVVYLLDANSCFGSFVEMVRLQTRKPHGYAPLVVVGIGYNTDAPFATPCRFRDFTVPAEPHELLQRKDGTAWPQIGEVEDFLDFLVREIKPFIQQLLPINVHRQALSGHSLGGLFTMHVLLTRPFEFQTYIAGSPSLWWKNGYLFEELPLFYQRLLVHTEDPSRENRTRLLLAVGGKEKQHMITDANHMYKRLSELEKNSDHFQIEFAWFENEGHISILPGLFNKALQFIFRQNEQKLK